MTLQALFDSYCISRSIEPTTIVSYQAAINVFNRWLACHEFSGINVDDIDIDLLNQFLTEYGATVSKYTVNSKRRILIALLNFHLEPCRQVITSKFVKRHKTSDTRRTSWMPEEVKRLFFFASHLPGRLSNGTSRADYFRCLLLVAWETAARRGDLTRITIEDIASGKPFLFVQKKTGTGVVYRLSASTVESILSMPHSKDSRFAFPSWSGETAWQLEAITKTCRKIMVAAGLKSYDGCLKKLRRSAITRAEEIMPGTSYRFAGHTTPTTTIKSYLDPTRSNQARLE